MVVPHGRDQADNARRVTERGAGLSLPARAAADEIAAAVQRLLTEPAFRAAAAELGGRVRSDAEASPLAEILEAQAQAFAPA
jgi:UDP:flavonoid glycosyltransferase YjiC (YdhE family)